MRAFMNAFTEVETNAREILKRHGNANPLRQGTTTCRRKVGARFGLQKRTRQCEHKAWFAIAKIILLTRYHLETKRPIQPKGILILGMCNQIDTMAPFAFLENQQHGGPGYSSPSIGRIDSEIAHINAL